MTQLEIIARVYDILSRWSRKDILAAARTPGLLAELRRSLEHLAEASDKLGTASYSKRPKDESSSPGHQVSRQDYEQVVTETIKNNHRFPSNDKLAAFLNKLGLDVSFNKKDGRQRMCDKTLRSLERSSSDEREKVLKRLANAADSETAGWFKAIRGDRH